MQLEDSGNKSKLRFNQNNKKFIVFNLVYLMILFSIYLFFTLNDKCIVWNSDARGQYVPNLHFLYSAILEKIKGNNTQFTQYSFWAGLGGDVSNLYFKGILDYIGVIFGRKNIEYTYTFLTLLRIYLTGISFRYFALYYDINEKYILPGALVYSFNGFTIYYGFRHMSFLIPVILLPLLIVSCEKVFRKESYVPFILIVFYSAWTDYYFLYMNTLILGIYIIFRWFYIKKINEIAKITLKMISYYAIGIALAAPSFLVKVSKLFGSTRTTSKTIETGSLLSYGKDWIANFFIRLISPYTTSSYTKYYMLYSMCAIIIPACFVFLIRKNKKYTKIKLGLLVGTVFCIIPVFAFIFSGFSSLVNRWIYAYALMLAVIVSLSMEYISESIKLKEVICLFLLLSIIGILNVHSGSDSTYVGFVFLFVSVIVVVIGNRLSKIISNKNLTLYLVTLLIFINILYNTYYILSPKHEGFISQFYTRGKLLDDYADSQYDLCEQIDDESFYRIESDTYRQNTANSSKIYWVNGTSTYDSTLNAALLNFNEKVANRGMYTINNFYGFDNRTILENLMGVKYIIGPDQNIPYGFSFYKRIDDRNVNIYKNDCLLPFAYVYNESLLAEDLNELNPIGIQNTMLDFAIVDNPNKFLSEYKGNDNVKKIDYDVSYSKILQDNNKYTAMESNAEIQLQFEGVSAKNVYLVFRGFDIDSVSDTSFQINIIANNSNKSVWVFNSNDKYKTNNYGEYCINLGWFDVDSSDVRIVLGNSGDYYFDDISIYTEDMTKYRDKIDKLKNDNFELLTYSSNHITGKLNASQDEMLVFQLLYDDGWNVTIDGKKVVTFCANYMFLACEIPSGSHKIELQYRNRYFYYGIYISLSTVFVIAVLRMLMEMKKNEREN